jgi:hypothetical protein
MTLTNILADLYRRLGYASSPASEVSTRLTAFVNQIHREIVSRPGLDQLLRGDAPITFASVASQAIYGLPQSVATVEAITDRTTNLRLREVSQSFIRDADPGLVQTGPPDCYAFTGIQAVSVQPSAAAEVFVKSTSAADTTQTAFIEGIRTGGYFKALSVTLNGTTAVSLSASFADFIEITKFYLSAVGAGTITLTQTSGVGTELARIPIGQTFARYQGVQLWPTPASAITYYVDYARTIPDMSNLTDEPLLPDDFHWLLVEGALVKEWTKKDDLQRRESARQDYERGLRSLHYRVTCPPDFLPSRTGQSMERSRFGAQYPATRS